MKNETNAGHRSLLATALSIAFATTAGGALAAAGAHDPQASQQSRMQSDTPDAAGRMDDSAIRSRVQSALQQRASGAADDIRVVAKNGIVSLSGILDNQAQVDQAVLAARGVEGVREVRSDLRLRVVDTQVIERIEREETNPAMLAKRAHQEERSERPLSDTWITTKVKIRIMADPDIGGRSIDIATVNGVVTLTGYVDDRDDLGRIVGLARSTDGVRDVRSSQLHVGSAGTAARGHREPEEDRPARAMRADTRGEQGVQGGMAAGDSAPRRMSGGDRDTSGDDPAASQARRDPSEPWSDAWITTKVKSSLLADPDISGISVDVQTVDGVVRLSGTVSSQEQVDRAVSAARSIEGVREVDASDLQQITAAN